MNAIVFGGSGFVGSHVADALSQAGHSVTVYDRAPSPWLRPDQRMVVGDVLDEQAVFEAMQGCQVAYNFAGLADIDEAAARPLDTIRSNILGNGILLEAARRLRLERYVFASTVYVYSNAGSFYRCSKIACENYIEQYSKQFGLDYTILRYGTLYGPRATTKNSIQRFIVQALTEKTISYPGDGQESREYIHVHDAAQGSVRILDPEFANQHVVLTGHAMMKVCDLFTMINEMLGHTVRVNYLPDKPSEHYKMTPYVFTPKVGRKLVNHCYTDLGQGLLLCIEEAFHRLREAQGGQGEAG